MTKGAGGQNEESEKHMLEFLPSCVVWKLKSMRAKVTRALVEDYCSQLPQSGQHNDLLSSQIAVTANVTSTDWMVYWTQMKPQH